MVMNDSLVFSCLFCHWFLAFHIFVIEPYTHIRTRTRTLKKINYLHASAHSHLNNLVCESGSRIGVPIDPSDRTSSSSIS